MSRIRITPEFLRWHLYLPVTVLSLALLVVAWSGLDLKLADLIYHLSGDQWSLRFAWLTNGVIHEAGRSVVSLAALVLLGLWLASFLVPALRSGREGWQFVLIASLLAALAINVLKRVTHMDCPWDLLRYGGEEPYFSLFSRLPPGKDPGVCFPAGHASAGWSWLALYYWALEYRSRLRKPLLGLVLTVGFVFGFSQQLRGAHFISHDLWTLLICWTLITGVYLLFYHRPFLAELAQQVVRRFTPLKSPQRADD
ncbi:MAG: phosphatase PAP2 family protein [Gammaproteobacteria bacterium]|nr:phosphatase PAP2 family protein [Pseudomonadales bacterium]MCP5348949.1 phosphatase PAP2 family protein [Pseudomonadales bacterium]